jgi:drug/metabolite transporter (DMT)-like permease
VTLPLSAAPAAGNRAGILFMLAAMAAFILNDACTKLASEELPAGEIIFLRGLMASPLILAVAWRRGALIPLSRLRHPAVVWRTLAEVVSAGLYLSALFRLPLANITAILQMAPLMATAGAALVLGERVGVRRWSAVAIGFLGVLIIVRPGLAGFDAWSLVAIAGVVFVVVRDLASRRLPPDMPTLMVTAAASIGVTALGASMMPFEDWSVPSPATLGLLALAAALVSAAYVAIVLALRAGEVAAVMPFRYTILVWALLLQVAVFGVMPDAATLIGSAVLVATGLYAFHRERAAQPRPAASLSGLPPE